MIRNYLKIAFRNLVKNRMSSLINIGGLTVGMVVALCIGCWIWDEYSFDKSNPNYQQVAQVMQRGVQNGEVYTGYNMPYPIGNELRTKYGSNFKYVVMSTNDQSLILSYGDRKFVKVGRYMDSDAPNLLSLTMLEGSRSGLQDPSSILLSKSTAAILFGNTSAMGNVIKLNNQLDVKVTGIYEDLPSNSSFASISFLAPWNLYVSSQDLVKQVENPWGNNSWQTFVQLANGKTMQDASDQIKYVKRNKPGLQDKKEKPEIFLHPMSKWHLYSEFTNGVITGGAIRYVWLFGVIGVFVLLLACINFMNLSTARSEKRAKEVGIRKAVGSARAQLIYRFYAESFLVVALAFILSLILFRLAMPFFNDIAGKKMHISWNHPYFWLAATAFCLFTTFVAGSYPALYLSGFQPVKVLKGVFRVSPLAAVPRKALVVLQFTVSITLIIDTIIVFRQIEFAKSRPLGYNQRGLLSIQLTTPDLHKHFEGARQELKNDGVIVEMAESWSPLTGVWSTNSGFNWKGKDPKQAVEFTNNSVSDEYGKTVGWKFIAGRDFSREFATDSTAFVINKAAAKFMGLKEPVGETITWDDEPFTIVGVIEDVLTESPYEPVRPSLFHLASDAGNFALLKIHPAIPVDKALQKIKTVFNTYNPAQPFEYQFVDEAFSKKFADEERIGKLASIFASLAIFISCLGLFGLASFVAEQRTREIGVRKVLGASVYNLWQLISREFIALIILAISIAAPVAWWLMHRWLQNYAYHTDLSWWIFIVPCAAALILTILTVSIQSIKAAMMNPVRSLRTE